MAKIMSLQAAYNGGLKRFTQHCLKYGTVTGYKDDIDAFGNETREISVIVQGCQATITKINGEIVQCSYYANF